MRAIVTLGTLILYKEGTTMTSKKPGATVHSSKSKAGRSTRRGASSVPIIRREAGQIFYVKQNGDVVKLPPSGPSNTVVRSGSLLPFPKDPDSPQG